MSSGGFRAMFARTPARLLRACAPRKWPHTGFLLELTEKNGAMVRAVRVQPRASRDAIAGEHHGALKIRLTAPPADGRANDACCRLLARQLKIPLSAVRILAGERSRDKRIAVSGVTAPQVMALATLHA